MWSDVGDAQARPIVAAGAALAVVAAAADAAPAATVPLTAGADGVDVGAELAAVELPLAGAEESGACGSST